MQHSLFVMMVMPLFNQTWETTKAFCETKEFASFSILRCISQSREPSLESVLLMWDEYINCIQSCAMKEDVGFDMGMPLDAVYTWHWDL